MNQYGLNAMGANGSLVGTTGNVSNTIVVDGNIDAKKIQEKINEIEALVKTKASSDFVINNYATKESVDKIISNNEEGIDSITELVSAYKNIVEVLDELSEEVKKLKNK